jgi:hypothetical protein
MKGRLEKAVLKRRACMDPWVGGEARPCRAFCRGSNRRKGGLHRSRGHRCVREARARGGGGARLDPDCRQGTQRAQNRKCLALPGVPCGRLRQRHGSLLEGRRHAARLRLHDLRDVFDVNQHPLRVAEMENLPVAPGRAEVPRGPERVLPAVAQKHREVAEGLAFHHVLDRCRVHARHRSPAKDSAQRQVQADRTETWNVGDASAVTRTSGARQHASFTGRRERANGPTGAGSFVAFVTFCGSSRRAASPPRSFRRKKRLFVGRRASTVRSKPEPGILNQAGGP